MSMCEVFDRYEHHFRSSEGRSLRSACIAWYPSVDDDDLFLSTLILGEIRKGVERVRPRDPAKAAALERWLRDVEASFDGRVLGIDNTVSDQWGHMGAIRPSRSSMVFLPRPRWTNGLTLVTRNEGDVAGLGATVLNPFKAR